MAKSPGANRGAGRTGPDSIDPERKATLGARAAAFEARLASRAAVLAETAAFQQELKAAGDRARSAAFSARLAARAQTLRDANDARDEDRARRGLAPIRRRGR